MSKFQHDVMLRIVKLLDVALVTLPFAACWFWYYINGIQTPLSWVGNGAVLLFYAVLFVVLGKIYDAFQISMQHISELIYSQVLASMAADGLLYIVICLMSAKVCNLLPGIAAIAGQIVIVVLWSMLAHRWYFAVFPPQSTAVIYDVRQGMEKLINEYELNQKYDVKVVLGVQECLDDLTLLDGMQTVFLSGIHSHDRNIILKYCVANNINVFMVPRIGDVIMSGAWHMHMFHLPMLRVGRYMASPEYCKAGHGYCAVPHCAGDYQSHFPGDCYCHQVGWRACILQTGAPDKGRKAVRNHEVPQYAGGCREGWCGAAFDRR